MPSFLHLEKEGQKLHKYMYMQRAVTAGPAGRKLAGRDANTCRKKNTDTALPIVIRGNG